MSNHSIQGALRAKSIFVNTAWSLLGQGAPLLFAAFSIPLLIRRIGLDRFGVLTLAWMLIGYFSLFDLGLGRAVTKLVAERLATGNREGMSSLVSTALLVMAALGAVFGASLCFCAHFAVAHVLKVPLPLQRETILSLYPLALSIPLVTLTSGFRGVLEAHHRFALVNTVRIALGVYSFLGPLLVSFFSLSLLALVLVLVLGRMVSCALYWRYCSDVVTNNIRFDARELQPLLNFGGWITVSNVLGPVMVYLDRFLIGVFISVSAVAYYTAPFEMVTKLWIISTAIVTVLFPAFSAAASADPEHMQRLYRRSVKYTFIVLYPVVLLLMIFSRELLKIWLGPKFALNSTIVLQWLTVGVFVNSLAYMPYALLQAIGRPDLTGKLHLIESPFYLAGLAWALRHHGIAGAACMWCVRLSVEALVLFSLARRLLGRSSRFDRRVFVSIAVSLAVLLCAALVSGMLPKTVVCCIGLPIFCWAAWSLGLTSEERGGLNNILRTRYRSLRASA